MRRSPMYKTPAQLRRMVLPGALTAASLQAARAMIVPGNTTAQIDRAAREAIVAGGGASNFQLVRGYRHTTCVSVNEQVVHGIPGERVIQPGDIVSVDSGAIAEGWNGDSAITVVVSDPERPELVAAREELSRVTERSMWAGVAAMASARRLVDISGAIEDAIVEAGHGYGILRDYVGHGIGRKMHESPSLFNYRVPDPGAEVRPGLVLAIEPMVVAGGEATLIEDDGWTVSTVDGSDGSHWEHTVCRHEGGIWVLTAPDGGAAGLAPFGITPVPLA